MLNSADLRQSLDACVRLFQGGRLAELRQACGEILAVAPDNADARHLIGLAAFREGRLDEALAHLDAAVAAANGNPAFHTNRAAVLEAAGRLDEAIEAYGRADALAPGTPWVIAALGSACERAGRLEEAADAYRRATAADGADADIWFNLGNVFLGLGRREDALTAFRRAEQENSQHFEAISNSAYVLRELGRAADADAVYRRAIAAGPRVTAVRVAYAKFLAELGRHEESLAAAQAALAIDSNDLHGHIALAWAAFCLGRLDDALNAYSAALNIDPLCKPAHVGLNRILWDRGAFDQFNRSYAVAAELAPGNAVAQFNLGTALADDQRRLDEAGAALRKALALRPDYAEAHGALAVVLRRQGRLPEAERAHARALELAPEQGLLCLECGVTRLLAGNAAGAVPALEQAVGRLPTNQTALAYFATALAAAGDARAASLLDYGRLVAVREIAAPPGYNDLAQFNAAVEAACRNASRTANTPYDQTLRGGTQSIGHLFRGAEGALADLEGAIRREVEAYAAALPDDPAHPFLARRNMNFVFEGCWSVILSDSGYHTNHTHNTWLSGVYYVRVPAVVDASDPERQGWLRLGIPDLDIPGAGRLPQRDVQPKPGRLVLFPSYVWHGTIPFEAPEERITVAFDIL